MSKKDKKAVENVVENEINDVENETWTTDADENESVEKSNTTGRNNAGKWRRKCHENNRRIRQWKKHDNVENVVEDHKWLIHVKAIFNRWSIDKGCEYWIEQKFFEEKKYLFEVLED